jgi:uncharacterized protein
MLDEKIIIQQTANWIKTVVIGLNFCPFAAAVVTKNQLRYVVSEAHSTQAVKTILATECIQLDNQENIATTLIILPEYAADFHHYLELLNTCEKELKKLDYEGIYQIASFHPQYVFAGSDEQDAANFTNRSPYPMLHLLREESIDKALENYPSPEAIPERNIALARKKGFIQLQKLLQQAMT